MQRNIDMKIQTRDLQEFQQAFKEDHKITLSAKEAKDAIENLTNFFNLLSDFDQEDKQKIKNRKEITYASHL